MTKKKMIKVTLFKSFNGRLKKHIACVHGLGNTQQDYLIVLIGESKARSNQS